MRILSFYSLSFKSNVRKKIMKKKIESNVQTCTNNKMNNNDMKHMNDQ